MTDFKQSTVYTHQFLMVLASDHISGATVAVIGGLPTVKLGKNGATGVTAAGTVAEVDATNLPGVFSIAFTAVDTNTAGSLALAATHALADPTNETHQVKSQIFTDLALGASGQVVIAAAIKQGQPVAGFPFLMTTGSPPVPGLLLTVTCQRNLGAGWANCATPIAAELGFGWYSVPFANTDTNAALVAFRATAPGANDQDILIPTYP